MNLQEISNKQAAKSTGGVALRPTSSTGEGPPTELLVIHPLSSKMTGAQLSSFEWSVSSQPSTQCTPCCSPSTTAGSVRTPPSPTPLPGSTIAARSSARITPDAVGEPVLTSTRECAWTSTSASRTSSLGLVIYKDTTKELLIIPIFQENNDHIDTSILAMHIFFTD